MFILYSVRLEVIRYQEEIRKPPFNEDKCMTKEKYTERDT